MQPSREIVQLCGDPIERDILDHAVRRVHEGRQPARVVKLSLLDFALLGRRLDARINTSPYGEWIRLYTPTGTLDAVPDAGTAAGTFELLESLR